MKRGHVHQNLVRLAATKANPAGPAETYSPPSLIMAKSRLVEGPDAEDLVPEAFLSMEVSQGRPHQGT